MSKLRDEIKKAVPFLDDARLDAIEEAVKRTVVGPAMDALSTAERIVAETTAARAEDLARGEPKLLGVWADVVAERERQDKEDGGPERDDTYEVDEWMEFIEYQLGKIEEIIGISDDDERYPRLPETPNSVLRSRYIKIAALAVAATESLDRYMERNGVR